MGIVLYLILIAGLVWIGATATTILAVQRKVDERLARLTGEAPLMKKASVEKDPAAGIKAQQRAADRAK